MAEGDVTVDLEAAVTALRALGIEAKVPDQSGFAEGFRNRLLLDVRGICVDEFDDWVRVELHYLDPGSTYYEAYRGDV